MDQFQEAETVEPASPRTAAMERLKLTPKEHVLRHGSNGHWKLQLLKDICQKLEISRTGSKEQLYQSIMETLRYRDQLDLAKDPSSNDNGGSSSSSSSSNEFRYEGWHIIRIINCVFWDGEGEVLDLSNRSWTEVVERFNDSTYDSGGIRVSDSMFDNINPEANVLGKITVEKMRNVFNENKKIHKTCLDKWRASGQNHFGENSFRNLCSNNVGPFYLFNVLSLLGVSQDFDSFMLKGPVADDGASTSDDDSYTDASGTRSSEGRGTKRSASSNDEIILNMIELVKAFLSSRKPSRADSRHQRLMLICKLDSQLNSDIDRLMNIDDKIDELENRPQPNVKRIKMLKKFHEDTIVRRNWLTEVLEKEMSEYSAENECGARTMPMPRSPSSTISSKSSASGSPQIPISND